MGRYAEVVIALALVIAILAGIIWYYAVWLPDYSKRGRDSDRTDR